MATAPAPQRQRRIRWVIAADGTRIAVGSVGDGPPLVRAAHGPATSSRPSAGAG